MKKELKVTIEFNNSMTEASVSVYECRTRKSTYHTVKIDSDAFGRILMDSWISDWKQVQEEKRKAIAEKKRKKEESKTKEESKHDKFLDICRKADAEGLSYAKYVQKYGV